MRRKRTPQVAPALGRKRLGGQTIERAEGRMVKKVGVYLEPSLARRLARWAVDTESEQSAFIARLIDAELTRQGY